MRRGKVLLLVAGVLTALAGAGLVAGGSVLVWAHATQRDAAGFYAGDAERFETSTFALRSPQVDLGAEAGDGDWVPFVADSVVRVTVRAGDGGDVFVGIARDGDVDRYLAATPHEELVDVSFAPFRAEYARHPGTAPPPAPPASQPFWVARAGGAGPQTVTWDVARGNWTVVVMNADASEGVGVDVAVGVKTGLLLPVGLGALAAGVVAAAAAAVMLVAAARRRSGEVDAVEPLGPAEPAADPYPVRLDARLDPALSRWRWLVKWLLALPHVVVLAFLWAAFSVLTVAAGVAVLFTGRYPRRIFDFNAGVLRWTWRVSFYALTLGTDRYPPFTLAPDPTYPAELSVDYPARLSRGLVLVKWWLLALPHYLVVSVFGGGLTWWTWPVADGDGRAVVGGGLVGLLVLVAGVTLAAAGRYPRAVFDFVMGMQRWTYRVVAYAALMRDEYPPFRLDQGGTDPASIAPTPAPEPPGPVPQEVGHAAP